MDEIIHQPSEEEQSKIYTLVGNNPEMLDLIFQHEITAILYVSDKSALFFLDGDMTHYYKYFLDERDGQPIRKGLANHTLRALEAQMIVQHLPGVQGIPFPRFYNDINGLLKMEYVIGESLGNPHEIEALKDPREVVRLFKGLEATLDAVHSYGVLHRDVKPLNLLHNESGLVVIDWDQAASFVRDHIDRGYIDKHGNPKPRLAGTFGYAYWNGERSADFHGATLSLLATVCPEIKVGGIYYNEEEFIISKYKKLEKFDQEVAELFLHFLGKDPEYHILPSRRFDTREIFENAMGVDAVSQLLNAAKTQVFSFDDRFLIGNGNSDDDNGDDNGDDEPPERDYGEVKTI